MAIKRRRPRADEEEGAGLPYPGHNWEVEQSVTPFEYRGVEVDWNPTDKKIGSIFLPDGEELEIWSDPVPFGFARWYETESQ